MRIVVNNRSGVIGGIIKNISIILRKLSSNSFESIP
jgi:hypothetical protein